MDETESIRRDIVNELNTNAGPREVLQARYGRVWDTSEMQNEFTAICFMAPLIVVRRKSDGTQGSLEFQHSPRLYFNWQADQSHGRTSKPCF